jgi:hypothetical protein
VNRWTASSRLLSALLLGACGPGHLPGSATPQPVYPGSGNLDADGTPDVRDQCPRDPGPVDQGGCHMPDIEPDDIQAD